MGAYEAPVTTLTASSGLWNNTTTWGGTTPVQVNDVVIPAGESVTVTSAKTLAQTLNLTIEAGGELKIDNGGSLDIAGNLYVESTGSGTGSG